MSRTLEGYDDWRLPTTADSNSSVGYPNGAGRNPPVSSSELAQLFYVQLGQLVGSAHSVEAQQPLWAVP